jgi:hypothetical protein
MSATNAQWRPGGRHNGLHVVNGPWARGQLNGFDRHCLAQRLKSSPSTAIIATSCMNRRIAIPEVRQ